MDLKLLQAWKSIKNTLQIPFHRFSWTKSSAVLVGKPALVEAKALDALPPALSPVQLDEKPVRLVPRMRDELPGVVLECDRAKELKDETQAPSTLASFPWMAFNSEDGESSRRMRAQISGGSRGSSPVFGSIGAVWKEEESRVSSQ